MSAFSKSDLPDDNSDESKRRKFAADFAQPYITEYEAVVIDAKHAAKTTATEWWQQNYARQCELYRSSKVICIKAIRDAALNIELADTTEDREKQIKEGVKGLTELREKHDAWLAAGVSPISSLADRADAIRDNLSAAASNREREDSLIARDLREHVGDIIAKLPQVLWNEETGVLEVTDAK